MCMCLKVFCIIGTTWGNNRSSDANCVNWACMPHSSTKPCYCVIVFFMILLLRLSCVVSLMLAAMLSGNMATLFLKQYRYWRYGWLPQYLKEFSPFLEYLLTPPLFWRVTIVLFFLFLEYVKMHKIFCRKVYSFLYQKILWIVYRKS